MPKLGYNWEQIEVEDPATGEKLTAVRVRNVEVMSLIRPEERPDFAMSEPGVDTVWLKSAIAMAQQLQAEGKYPKLFLRHNKPYEEAPVIGRLENLRWEAPWIVADVVVTNPEAIEMLKRGELPTRSAEFNYATRHLWGMALIQGEKGHFDTEIPEMILKDSIYTEVMQLAGDPKSNRTLVLSRQLKLEAKMDPEVKAAIDQLQKQQSEQNVVLKQVLDHLRGTKSLGNEGDKGDKGQSATQAGSGQGNDANSNPALKAAQETQQQLAKHIEETKLNGLVAKVRASGNVMLEKDVREKLSALKEWESRELLAEQMCNAPKAPNDPLAAEGSKLNNNPANRQIQNDYRAKIAEKMKSRPSLSKAEAVCEVNAENPDLHRKYILSRNPGKTEENVKEYFALRAHVAKQGN